MMHTLKVTVKETITHECELTLTDKQMKQFMIDLHDESEDLIALVKRNSTDTVQTLNGIDADISEETAEFVEHLEGVDD